MADQTTKRKNVQINTTVSPEVHDALRKYRFQNEIEKMGDVLELAVTDFLAAKGITVEPTPATTASK